MLYLKEGIIIPSFQLFWYEKIILSTKTIIIMKISDYS